MHRLPHRPVPAVDYFSFPDLALSGGQPNLLSLRSVDVAYGQVQVLFGVNLELRAGETIALLGTNGAGKSTVLRAISGLVAPKHGTVSHEGVDISGMGPHHIARRGLIQVPGGGSAVRSTSAPLIDPIQALKQGPQRRCENPACGQMIPVRATACPVCGTPLPPDLPAE